MNPQRLFLASCVALAATAMTFAIRGDIMGDFERDFVVPMVAEEGASAEAVVESDALIKTRLGLIGGAAFVSFGFAILFGGPLVDLLGMGRLLRLAAACHIGGVFMTIFAPNFWVLYAATFVIGIGNGLVEAVCNPLIATMYPNQKTRKLTLFHAWFPGGIVIGGVLAFLISRLAIATEMDWLGWQLKMALILVPCVIYTVMIIGQDFPPTERVASGFSFGSMFQEAFTRPLFIIIFLVMWLTAGTELGAGAWIADIYNDVMSGLFQTEAVAGILFLVWGNAIMYVLRQFFSNQAHKMSPALLIAGTAPFAAAGLFLSHYATTPLLWFIAATLLYFGVAFWWPTMLGFTNERCPKTGALGLAVIGATGSFSTVFTTWAMGLLNDWFGPDRVLQIWAAVPVLICVIFGAVYLRDRSLGGYKIEHLGGDLADAPAGKAEEAPTSDL